MEARYAMASCQPRQARVHLALPIYRRMVAMEATQGVYSAQKTKKA